MGSQGHACGRVPTWLLGLSFPTVRSLRGRLRQRQRLRGHMVEGPRKVLPTQRLYAGPWLQGHREEGLGLLYLREVVSIACAAWVPASEDRFPEHRLERVQVAGEGAMEDTAEIPCAVDRDSVSHLPGLVPKRNQILCNPKNQIWDLSRNLSQSGCGIKSGINTTFWHAPIFA